MSYESWLVDKKWLADSFCIIRTMPIKKLQHLIGFTCHAFLARWQINSYCSCLENWIEIVLRIPFWHQNSEAYSKIAKICIISWSTWQGGQKSSIFLNLAPFFGDFIWWSRQIFHIFFFKFCGYFMRQKVVILPTVRRHVYFNLLATVHR